MRFPSYSSRILSLLNAHDTYCTLYCTALHSALTFVLFFTSFHGDVAGDSESNNDDRNTSVTTVKDDEFLEAKESLLDVLKECQFVDLSNYSRAEKRFTSTENDDFSGLKEEITTNVPPNPLIDERKKGECHTADLNSFEISAEQFENVPVSIRGRCKMIDVQMVLARLLAYYNTHINSSNSNSNSNSKRWTLNSFINLAPLSTSDLTLSGLKVAGKTGDCVIGTLRSLGLIKIGKSNNPGLLLSDFLIQKLLRV